MFAAQVARVGDVDLKRKRTIGSNPSNQVFFEVSQCAHVSLMPEKLAFKNSSGSEEIGYAKGGPSIYKVKVGQRDFAHVFGPNSEN